jgi:hypothetical protein
MNINLTIDEAQALLDGINVMIEEQARDLEFWRHAPIPQSTRDQFGAEYLEKLAVAKSARTKVAAVR